MILSEFDSSGFQRGRPAFIEFAWIVTSAIFVNSCLPGSLHRRVLLRFFGARIGKRVIIKPSVRVKLPWRLHVADDVWIGEDVWIDNLADVRIARNVCLSQGAYLCTGSHNWSSRRFDLIAQPITIEKNAWIAAKAVVAPGVTVQEGAVLALGSVAVSDLSAWTIHQGAPAQPLKPRQVHGQSKQPTSARGNQ